MSLHFVSFPCRRPFGLVALPPTYPGRRPFGLFRKSFPCRLRLHVRSRAGRFAGPQILALPRRGEVSTPPSVIPVATANRDPLKLSVNSLVSVFALVDNLLCSFSLLRGPRMTMGIVDPGSRRGRDDGGGSSPRFLDPASCFPPCVAAPDEAFSRGACA